MKPQPQTRCLSARLRFFTAAVLLAVFPGAMLAQAVLAPAGKAPGGTAAAAPPPAKPIPQPSTGAQRRALKLYLEASKLFMASRFEEAMSDYEQAAKLNPGNADYQMAIRVTRSHLVAVLIQTAAKDQLLSNPAGARAALAQALKLDPKNPEVAEHLQQLGNDLVAGQPTPLYTKAGSAMAEPVQLVHTRGLHSFHLRNDQRLVIQQVFKAFGLDALVNESVRSQSLRFDIGDANFAEATRALGLATDSFYVPVDAHRVLVLRDTRENRAQYTPLALETAYLGGVESSDLHEVALLARNVFAAQRVATDDSADTITLRAPQVSLNAFNNTIRTLLDGSSQVMLDVRLIQLLNSSTLTTGLQPPQSISAFNVAAEEQSILSANQSLVQQIISSGLAAPGDLIGILGILIASGQVSSALFSNGFALFGGGLTESALAPGATSFTFNLNSTQTRILDQIEFRLGDGQEHTLRDGTRYPIQTAEYSSPGSGLPNIPGITGAGSSGSLGSLLTSLQGAMPAVPMIQYQDLGLTLKVTPAVMRSSRVALKINMQIDGLSGSSLDGNPILNNLVYSGVVTVKDGDTVEVASEIDKSESYALTGTPGIGEIPGLNQIEANNNQKNYATLLILLTPHLIRGAQAAGHTPMLAVAKGTQQTTGPTTYPTPLPTPQPARPKPVPARPMQPPQPPQPMRPMQSQIPGLP